MKQFIFDPATTPLTIPLDFLKLFHSSDNPVGLASFLRGVVGVASLPPAGPFYFTKPMVREGKICHFQSRIHNPLIQTRRFAMLNINDKLLDILNEQEVYLCLQILRYMRPENMVSWPSITTLCSTCKWDERKVVKYLKSLCEKGVLQVEKAKGVANKYRLSGDDFGVYAPKKQSEPPTKNVGTINAVPPKIVPTIIADNHPPKLGVEVINKEVINNTLSLSKEPAEKIEPENKKIETATEAEALIFSWQNSAGAATIQHWYERSKKRFIQPDFEQEVTKFCGHYLTTADEGKCQRFKREPLLFFQNGFPKWLADSEQFSRRAQTQQSTQGNASRNSTIQNTDSRFNSQETLDRAERIIARLQANGM